MFDEIHPRPDRHSRRGREGRTAAPVSHRWKIVLAGVGALLCLGLALWAWWLGLYGLMVPLAVLVVWAMADIGWQWYRARHPRKSRRL